MTEKLVNESIFTFLFLPCTKNETLELNIWLMKHFFAIVSFITLLSIQSLTAAEQYWFNHYQTKDGLPSNTIYAVVQDKYNFIWRKKKKK